MRRVDQQLVGACEFSAAALDPSRWKLALLVSFAQDMFPGVSTEDIGVWPADDGELVVSVRGGGGIQSN